MATHRTGPKSDPTAGYKRLNRKSGVRGRILRDVFGIQIPANWWGRVTPRALGNLLRAKGIYSSALERIVEHAVDEILVLNAISAPTEETLPSRTRDYWDEQLPGWRDVRNDPAYQAEQRKDNALVLTGHNPNPDKAEHHPPDPSNPRAYIPAGVRFFKRREQQFRCAITGWSETEWIRNKQSGEIRPVGRLTVDHTLAGKHGGLTTALNTKMVASVVNSKKGAKFISAEDLRKHMFDVYEIFEPSAIMLEALEQLRDLKVKKVILV